MRWLPVLLILAAPPVVACPHPPPEGQLIANDKATIAPDGGVIVRVVRGAGDPALTIHADGSKVDLTQEMIGFDLLVLKPKAGTKDLAHVRNGKVVTTMRVAATPTLAAPTLVRVLSTAKRDTKPMKYSVPSSQVRVELGVETPADAYTLVIYKIDRDGARGIADGTPTNRFVGYQTGGKNCGYGMREQVFPGDRIAVAWLDVHGKLSPRSQPMIVRSK